MLIRDCLSLRRVQLETDSDIRLWFVKRLSWKKLWFHRKRYTFTSMYLIVLSFVILLCSFHAAFSSAQPRHPRASGDQCHSLVDGPFRFCSTKGGYNTTFQIDPDFLTDSIIEQAAETLSESFSYFKNCSRNGLIETLICHYVIPQCSGGKRVYPCKRVCSEFLKQCEDRIPETLMDSFIATCHVLPDELGSSGNCFEPPNFSTNDSIKGKY